MSTYRFNVKKNFYIIFLLILLLVTSPFFLRYLIINQKISILNSIYFKFPGLITRKKSCPSYVELLNKSLDKSFSVSIINKNGQLISSYNDEVLRVPASNQKLFSSAYVLSKYKLKNNLKTSLFKNKNNLFSWPGDPDLNYGDIRKLISNVEGHQKINFNIIDINSRNYWLMVGQI